MDNDRHEASTGSTRINTIVLAFTVVTGLLVTMRLFGRLIPTRISGVEDIWIVVALGLSIGLTATVSEQAANGLGKHVSQLSASKRLTFLKAFWIGLWLHSLALTMTKISNLVQLLRVFPVRHFRLSCYYMLATVIVYGAWAVASNIFICNSVSFSWNNNSSKNGYCMDRKLIWYTNSGISIAQDLIILLLPMPLVRSLHISSSQKRGLVIMMIIGASAPLISIVRLYTLNDVAKSSDISFDNSAHATLSVLEVNTGIVCACLPAMRPLLALLMPKYFSAATLYMHAPGMPDIERQSSSKYERAPLSSTSQINNTYISTSGTGPTMPETPQALKPTLLRTPSGRFIIKHHASPNIPGRTGYISHSRSGSNISIDIAAADARLHGPRLHAQYNSLHQSLITPYSPLNPRVLFPASGPGTSCVPSRDTSGASSPAIWRAQTAFGPKPLPLTPFPVDAGA